MTAWELIKSDLYRYSRATDLKTLLRHYFRTRSFKYSFWFRLASSSIPAVNILARLMHKHLTVKYGIQIPRVTDIGPGLFIGHSMSVIIHPKTKIGSNFTISQFTTIGSNNNTPAIIDDNVYIGPGCSIVEKVRIGANARIGAGSVVVKDVPKNTTVAGNPAKVISQNHNDPEDPNYWRPR